MPSRPRTAVGRNVLRKEGVEKVTGAARYVDDLTFPNLLHARTIRSTIPAGDILDVRLNFDTDGIHGRRPSRHSGAERRRADRRRSAVPGRARRPSRRRADRAAGPRGSRHAAGRRRADLVSSGAAGLRSGGVADHVQDDHHRERPRRRRIRRRRCDRRGRISHRSSGAAVHRAERRDCRVGQRRHHGLRLAAVSVLRPSGAEGAARAARRQSPRHPDRDRRWLRRQGRIPVDDRRPRGASRAEGRAGR